MIEIRRSSDKTAKASAPIRTVYGDRYVYPDIYAQA